MAWSQSNVTYSASRHPPSSFFRTRVGAYMTKRKKEEIWTSKDWIFFLLELGMLKRILASVSGIFAFAFCFLHGLESFFDTL